jgi:hypothetical protein
VWLSATQFVGHPSRRVEGVFGVRTRLFGRAPMPTAVSILWTTDGDRREELVANVNAMIGVKPTASGVTIEARGVGKRHRLAATWSEVSPNDIGEGIIQTMHGDLRFDDLEAVPERSDSKSAAIPARSTRTLRVNVPSARPLRSP